MGTLLKVVALVLLSALSEGQLPEDEFRIIDRQDLLQNKVDIFEDSDSKSFSQLLFDVARDQVVVGARDTLYRLSLRGFRVLERVQWHAPPDKVQLCQDKGQTEDDCHNYIKVLLSYGHKLFACGTNAFSPECSWREIESLNTVSETLSGVANCPYNPHSNVTGILSSNGEYYAGTPTDFGSSDTTICRSRGVAVKDSGMLRTTQSDFIWLNEPQFVGSFEDDSFVYFVFREVAVEYMNCGKIIYSRIARVCKNDSGGHLSWSRNRNKNWSTFLKARLICSVPGEVPFYYDEIQSIEYIPQENILVGTFTTTESGIPGSAICVYNMSDIHAAFSGPYKMQDSPRSSWEASAPTDHSRRQFSCEPDSSSDPMLEYHQYHLMHQTIEPISKRPVYKMNLERFTHISVDVLLNKVGKHYVFYVSTLKSDVLKLAVLSQLDQACLVEIWRLSNKDNSFKILTMQFVKDTMSLYIGADTSVVRLPASRCQRSSSRQACIQNGDPHCGWDDGQQLCIQSTALTQNYIVPTEICTSNIAKVDGDWSSWSDWEPCIQHNTGSPYDEPDKCMCRRRRCDNPVPRNGRQCLGASISVSNCTVHGVWSAWSSWSACSATCGLAAKSRRRSCTEPAPAFGGRTCVGLPIQHMHCYSLPPCDDPELAPIDGGWSSWSSWSACVTGNGANCGEGTGTRERRRNCDNPKPERMGSDCDGDRVEHQTCDLKPCELRKGTAWSPWVRTINQTDGSYMEKRFKFLCKAPPSDQLKLSVSREEIRYCNGQGACSPSPLEENERFNAKKIPTGKDNVNSNPCLTSNQRPATEQWTCWSEWSPCVADCTRNSLVGRRTRTRACLSPDGCGDASSETRLCVADCNSDEGWSMWGAWSECDAGAQVRRRSCDSHTCVGPTVQVAACSDNDEDNELFALPAYSEGIEMASFIRTGEGGPIGVGGIVSCVLAAFVIGNMVCLAGVIFFSRRGNLSWRSRSRVPSSPHYITSKQNTYVTVPLKDVPRKAKRQPSFSGIGGGSGIILSKSNNLSNANNHNIVHTTPKLYPKAIANDYDSMGTLRRHSNQPNNKNNLDLEEERFY